MQDYGATPEPSIKAFVESLRDTEFDPLVSIFGEENRSDAFHFWTAERNKCKYFLTFDFKLIEIFETMKIRTLLSNTKCLIVSPSKLRKLEAFPEYSLNDFLTSKN